MGKKKKKTLLMSKIKRKDFYLFCAFFILLKNTIFIKFKLDIFIVLLRTLFCSLSRL